MQPKFFSTYRIRGLFSTWFVGRFSFRMIYFAVAREKRGAQEKNVFELHLIVDRHSSLLTH
jgi:hypothetical protein